MDEINEKELEEKEDSSEEKIEFTCPNCGKVSRNDVLFLCNTCKSEDVIDLEGVYVCPSCLVPGENFECNSCGSTDVKMFIKNK